MEYRDQCTSGCVWRTQRAPVVRIPLLGIPSYKNKPDSKRRREQSLRASLLCTEYSDQLNVGFPHRSRRGDLLARADTTKIRREARSQHGALDSHDRVCACAFTDAKSSPDSNRPHWRPRLGISLQSDWQSRPCRHFARAMGFVDLCRSSIELANCQSQSEQYSKDYRQRESGLCQFHIMKRRLRRRRVKLSLHNE